LDLDLDLDLDHLDDLLFFFESEGHLYPYPDFFFEGDEILDVDDVFFDVSLERYFCNAVFLEEVSVVSSGFVGGGGGTAP